MADKVMSASVQDAACLKEATCIHTKKIYDSCQAKDCIEDLRLYPTVDSQAIIDRAVSIKAGTAELLYVYIDVEPISFNRGFYTVDLRYFYRITADAFIGAPRPVQISGLAVFDKRTVLFGSDSGAKTFSSQQRYVPLDTQCIMDSSLPTAVVEAVDPVLLSLKLVDLCDCRCDCDVTDIPAAVIDCFGAELVFNSDSAKRVYVTLGQFSLLRLERETQLLIPVYDYCLPGKECDCGCDCGCDQDPCDLFQKVEFPVEDFFPSTVAPRGDTCGSGSSSCGKKCCRTGG